MAYQTIYEILERNDSDMSPAEIHGLASGMLCIEIKAEAISWLAELFAEDVVLLDEDKSILVALFEQTRKLLEQEDDSFRYDLFLPAEDDELAEQLEAVRNWCAGFLFGIGYSRSESTWPGETGEIMQDIVEFTKLDSELDDDLDEEERDEYESALMEIQEYLRVAVMMLKELFSKAANEQTH